MYSTWDLNTNWSMNKAEPCHSNESLYFFFSGLVYFILISVPWTSLLPITSFLLLFPLPQKLFIFLKTQMVKTVNNGLLTGSKRLYWILFWERERVLFFFIDFNLQIEIKTPVCGLFLSILRLFSRLVCIFSARIQGQCFLCQRLDVVFDIARWREKKMAQMSLC